MNHLEIYKPNQLVVWILRMVLLALIITMGALLFMKNQPIGIVALTTLIWCYALYLSTRVLNSIYVRENQLVIEYSLLPLLKRKFSLDRITEVRWVRTRNMKTEGGLLYITFTSGRTRRISTLLNDQKLKFLQKLIDEQ